MSNPTPLAGPDTPTSVSTWENEGGASTPAIAASRAAPSPSDSMVQTNAASPRRMFLSGDAIVVLYDGRYNGMLGHFVKLRSDPNWADVKDQDGITRPHPVAWLRRPEELPSAAALLAEDAARN